jgi:hypothetical protein
MRARRGQVYNGPMSTTDDSPRAPDLGVASSFLEELATGEFARLAPSLEADVTMRALLPGGYREWQGVDEVCARFEKWFGDVDQFEVVETAVGQVGPRLQLRWRVRVVGERFGDGDRLVEQIAFADAGATGRIGMMSLLCSGYTQENLDD